MYGECVGGRVPRNADRAGRVEALWCLHAQYVVVIGLDLAAVKVGLPVREDNPESGVSGGAVIGGYGDRGNPRRRRPDLYFVARKGVLQPHESAKAHHNSTPD